MGYIYLVTNKINGKRYVGQTQREDIEMRWRDHKRLSTTSIGRYLLSSYRKYGINNFKFEIICICFNEDCDKYEEEYIKIYNTIAPNGYNIKCSGISTPVSQETRVLIGKRMKETMTIERRAEISRIHKGKQISNEHKKQISTKNKDLWKNMSDEDKMNIIKKRMNNPSYVNSYKKGLKIGPEVCKKRVGKFDDNGMLLESFESVSDASNKTNINRVGISKVCLQKPYYHKAGGFIWKFI